MRKERTKDEIERSFSVERLRTSPNQSYFVKRRHTSRSHPRRVSENLDEEGTENPNLISNTLIIKFSKGEFKILKKENCISF